MFKDGRKLLTLMVASCILCGGCSSSPETPPTPDPAILLQQQQEAEALARQQKEEQEALERLQLVKDHAAAVADLISRQAKPAEFAPRLQARLDTSMANSEKRKTNKNIPMDLRYDNQMLEFYTERDFTPLLLSGTELNEPAQLLLSEVQQVKRHALSENDYPIDRLRKALDQLEQEKAELANGIISLDEDDIEKAVNWVKTENILPDDPELDARMAAFLLSENGSPRLKQAVKDRTDSIAANIDTVINAEVLLLDAWLKLARDIKFNNFNAVTEEEAAFLGETPTDDQKRELVIKRIRQHLKDFGNAIPNGIESTADLIRKTYPPHEQYAKLLDIHDRYEKIVEDGGWTTIKPAAIKKGKNSETARALKKRLSIEGYYHGPDDDIYDDALSEAIVTYKETHQMETLKSKDEMGDDFWKSLNTPAKERLQQIDVNIGRWHETFLQDVNYYIYVNVPDFQLEVWKDHQLQRRFPVVVGNSGKGCNSETKRLYLLNATPLQHAKMHYVEYNPYWIVPPRIEHQEYLPKILEDPNWLKEHGFEYYTENGRTVLRQLPSETNSLGRVKFIFPNKHSTFFHDTPLKGLFKRPIRAFSHGCMRVQDPLELAELLLKNDGQWRNNIPKEIEDLQPKRFNFKERFDVFIDYYTVRVDKDGNACFLADPYRYVRDVIDPPDPKTLKCTPKASEKLSRPSLETLAGSV